MLGSLEQLKQMKAMSFAWGAKHAAKCMVAYTDINLGLHLVPKGSPIMSHGAQLVTALSQASQKTALEFLFGDTKSSHTHRQCTINMHDRPGHWGAGCEGFGFRILGLARLQRLTVAGYKQVD